MSSTPGGQLERMGYAISRYWRQKPWWFDGLEKEKQILLIADYQLSNQDQKTKKKTEKNRIMERIRKRREEIKSQGAKYEYR